MPDDDIQALDLCIFEDLHQGCELDLAANQQSASAKCGFAPAGKNPIAIDRTIFRTFKNAAHELVDGGSERRWQARVGDAYAHHGSALGVDSDFQFGGLSGLGRGLLRHGSACQETREAEPC
jgi:hypothetical protein